MRLPSGRLPRGWDLSWRDHRRPAIPPTNGDATSRAWQGCLVSRKDLVTHIMGDTHVFVLLIAYVVGRNVLRHLLGNLYLGDDLIWANDSPDIYHLACAAQTIDEGCLQFGMSDSVGRVGERALGLDIGQIGIGELHKAR